MSDDLHLGIGVDVHKTGSEAIHDLEADIGRLKRSLESIKKLGKLGDVIGSTKGLDNIKKVAEQAHQSLKHGHEEITAIKKAVSDGTFEKVAAGLKRSTNASNAAYGGRIKAETKLSALAIKNMKLLGAAQEYINKKKSQEYDIMERLSAKEAKLIDLRKKEERRNARKRGVDRDPMGKGLVGNFLGRDFASSMKNVAALSRAAEAAAKKQNALALKGIKDGIKASQEAQRIEDDAVKASFNRHKYIERVKRNSAKLDAKLNPQHDAHASAYLKAKMGKFYNAPKDLARDLHVKAFRLNQRLEEQGRKKNLADAMKDERVRFSFRRHQLENEQEYINRMPSVRRRATAQRNKHLRHAGSHLSHGFHAISHPYFSSPAFAAEVALTAAIAGLTHAIEETRHFDKELTNLRIRAGMSREEGDAAGRKARITGSDYGVGGAELLKIQTEAASRGLSKDLVDGLGPTILKFSESIGQPASEAADASSDFIQQLASMHKIHGIGEAHRTLNTAAKLSNRFGGGQRMLQAFENGLAERGAVLGLSPKDTLALGALFNASGARNGRTSTMAMGAFAEQAPGWRDKWLSALSSNSMSQGTQLMRKAPGLLGYGNIGEMQGDAMGKNGLGGIVGFIQRFERIKDEGSRRQLQQELGFTSEIAGIFEGILHSPENVRDAKRLSREGWSETDDKTDTLAKNQKMYRQSLTYSTDVIHSAFENIEIAIGEGMNRSVLLKLVKSFHGISVWSTYELPKIVDQMIHGFVEGLGFHGMGRLDNISVMIKVIGDEIRKVNWKVVGHDLAEALKGIGEGIRSLWGMMMSVLRGIRNALSWFGLGGDESTRNMAKLGIEFAGLALALHALTPVIGVLGILVAGIRGITSALQAAKQNKVLEEVAKNTKGTAGEAAGAGEGIWGRIKGGLKGGVKAIAKGGAVSMGVDLAGQWLMNKVLGWNDEKETKFNKVMEYPALTELWNNIFGIGSAHAETTSGSDFVKGPHGGLVSSQSYAPSNVDNAAKSAVIETKKGVDNVRNEIVETNDLLKKFLISQEIERVGTGAGDGEGARNLRYGPGGHSLPRSDGGGGGGGGGGRRRGGGGGHDSGDRTHVSGQGPSARLDRNKYATGENADAIIAAAKELGTTPEDLATVISYESAGSFSPNKVGGRGRRYQGLIQFGPPERRQFGVYKGQSFPDQMKSVVKFLKTRGYKPGMGLLDLYSTINAGSPGHYNASDGNGTVRSHVAKMQREHGGAARGFLKKSQNYHPGVPGMASGGHVRGKGSGTSDSIPVMLSNGEFVVNAKAAGANLDLLHVLNGYSAPPMSKMTRRYLNWAKVGGGYSRRRSEPTGTLPYSTVDGWSGKVLGYEDNDGSHHVVRGAQAKLRRIVDSGLNGLVDGKGSGWTKNALSAKEIDKKFDDLTMPYGIGHAMRDLNQKQFGGANLNDRLYGAKHNNPKVPRAFDKEGFIPGIPAGMAADKRARNERRESFFKEQLKDQLELNRLADEASKNRLGSSGKASGFELPDDLKELMRAKGIDPDTGKKITPSDTAAKVHGAMLGMGGRQRTADAGSGHTINNHFHIHDASDPHKVAHVVGKHIDTALNWRAHDVAYNV